MLQVDSIEKGAFEASEVNICTVEVAEEVASIMNLFIVFNFIILVMGQRVEVNCQTSSFVQI